MANRIDATLGGMATIQQTADAWRLDIGAESRHSDSIASAKTALMVLLSDEQSRRAALALACAVLNTTFEERGWLFHVDGKSHLTPNFFALESDRKPILALMAD